MLVLPLCDAMRGLSIDEERGGGKLLFQEIRQYSIGVKLHTYSLHGGILARYIRVIFY